MIKHAHCIHLYHLYHIVTHVYVSELDNGLSPIRHKAITRSNADVLSIALLEIDLNEI